MTEAEIQREIVFFLRAVLPRTAIVHATLAEGNRGKTVGMLDGMRRRAMGQQAGMPDLLIFAEGRVYGIEVKSQIGRLSDVQRSIHAIMISQGIPVAVVRSVEDARGAINEWGISREKRGAALSQNSAAPQNPGA